MSSHLMSLRRNHRWTSASIGFTLVELLVVIGLIALLIGILLPVLASVGARGRDLVCQSNIRQCVQLILTYASEHKGQFPYGMYYVTTDADEEGWGPAGDLSCVHLWSVIANMSSKEYKVEDYAVIASGGPKPVRKLPAFMRCPEAQQVQPHLCAYAGNRAAFIVPEWDVYWGARRDGPGWTRLVERPTTISQCFPYTALVWETAVSKGNEWDVGWFVGVDVDALRHHLGVTRPQWRYFCANDPFEQISPHWYGNNRPVRMISASAGAMRWYNIDPPTGLWEGIPTWPYEGNLRFRHNKNTTCNVGYADGHVDRFKGNFTSDKQMISHDALRKYFLVKWPSGVGIAPDPSLPF